MYLLTFILKSYNIQSKIFIFVTMNLTKKYQVATLCNYICQVYGALQNGIITGVPIGLMVLTLVSSTSCKTTKEDPSSDESEPGNPNPKGNYQPDPGGLPNIGNTCYMNAALQFFAAVDEYAAIFLKPVVTLGAKEKTLAATGVVIMQKIKANELIDEAVMTAFYNAAAAMGWPESGNKPYVQEDSPEFMIFVLDKLQAKQLIQLQNRIIPDGGAEVLDHVESSPMLSLPIKSASTMSAAMQLFFITEKLTADNKYYDVSQGKQVDATKQPLLANLPNPLLIQLGRVGYIAGKKIKIETSLSVPPPRLTNSQTKLTYRYYHQP